MTGKQQSADARGATRPGADERVRPAEKIAFFCANFTGMPMTAIIASYLTIFYTDVVGLDPAAVGLLFLVGRLTNACCDPFVGYAIDHFPRTRWGRFRPWIFLGTVAAALNFSLLWLGPSLAARGKLLVAYISFLLMGPTFAAADTATTSLLPAATASGTERASLSTVKGLATMISAVLANVLVVPFVGSFQTPRQGYHAMAVGVAVFVAIMALVGAAGTRERVNPASSSRYSASFLLALVCKTGPFLILSSCATLVALGMCVRGGATMYYLSYNFGDSRLMVPFMAFGLAASLLGMILSTLLVRRFEKKAVMLASVTVYAVGMLILLAVRPGDVASLLLTTVMASLGSGVFSPIYFAMLADITEYVEWRHGYRAEGAVASMTSFIGKIGQAVGVAFTPFLLGRVGYVANAASQEPRALMGIAHAMSTIPFALTMAGALVFVAYPITRPFYERIRAELSGRSGTAGGESIHTSGGEAE